MSDKESQHRVEKSIAEMLSHRCQFEETSPLGDDWNDECGEQAMKKMKYVKDIDEDESEIWVCENHCTALEVDEIKP